MIQEFVDREQSRMLSELAGFLAIPSVSALPAHATDCRRAAEWLVQHLRQLGCPVAELLEGDGHPVVWGESPRAEGKPTVLIYGHYDVQPPDPLEEWHTPPFQPTLRDGKLFARGSADDKGQLFALLKAYEATLGHGGVPPVNVRFLFEGEEESGGHVLPDLLAKEPWRVEADAVLVADMSFYAPGIPAVYTALRGMCYAEIEVRTLERDLHSGTYGGVAPNALETLCRLLARLKREDGTIKLPKLYRSVTPPSKQELRDWKQLPFDEAAFIRDEMTAQAATGLEDATIFERTWALPTFEIHGIIGGFTGAGAKTVIPAKATAKVSLRLVPGLGTEQVLAALEKAVAKYAPPHARATVRFVHGSDPVQVPVDARPFGVLDTAFEEVVGRRPVRVRAGGSIPVVPELGRAGAPVILTGIGLPDDGLHSPNEKLDVAQLWTGVRVFGRFLERMGEG